MEEMEESEEEEMEESLGPLIEEEESLEAQAEADHGDSDRPVMVFADVMQLMTPSRLAATLRGAVCPVGGG